MTIEGKVVLITGAKGGLGNYVTEAFLAGGATVAGSSRSIADSDFSHAGFAAFPAELSGAEAARGLVSAVVARFGRLDCLVHLVGTFAGGARVDETGAETVERMLDVNFRAAFHVVGAAVSQMRGQGSGRVLAIGSRTAVEPAAGLGAYNASKAALVALIRTVALENRDAGISANVVLPGTMDTPANRKAMPGADFSKWVDPRQVAALLVHLASDAGGGISGAAIPVYGGEL